TDSATPPDLIEPHAPKKRLPPRVPVQHVERRCDLHPVHERGAVSQPPLARRTLPSSTAPTRSVAPTSRAARPRPPTANAEVRPTTLSPATLPSAPINSSVSPSTSG